VKNRHGPATVMQSKSENVTEKLGRQEAWWSRVRRTA